MNNQEMAKGKTGLDMKNVSAMKLGKKEKSQNRQ